MGPLHARPLSGTGDTDDLDVARAGEDLPLLEGIRTTRAIRRLKSSPVPAALIRKVCEAGTFAPSGGNRQPWIFVAVTDRERRERIAVLYRRAFAAYSAPAFEAARSPTYPATQRRNLESAKHLADTLGDVPVLLFVAGWTRRGAPQEQALFPCIQNVLLACRAVGLGASLTTLHRTYQREVDDLVGLPENRPSSALLPLGWPEIPYRRPQRRPVDECLFWERYTEPV